MRRSFGQARPELLTTYQAERQPIARRNTGYAKQFAESLGLYVPAAEIEEESARRRGAAYRRGVSRSARPSRVRHSRHHLRRALLLTCHRGRRQGTAGFGQQVRALRQPWRTGAASLASPERSLYDVLGFEWSLLRLSRAATATRFAAAAAYAGMPLKVVDVWREDARDLYEADLALIRPDQIVAWLGNSDEDAAEIVRRVLARPGSENGLRS